MDWIEFESFWLFCPDFADVFVGREAIEGFEPSSVVVSVDEVRQMGFELLMAVIVVAFDGGFLNGPVHALHLPVGPWMPDFGQAVLNAIFLTPHVKHMGHVPGSRTISIARREGELDAVTPSEQHAD